ncbi:DUF2617 family protein [Kocuria rhizophila]|uniref:DUF2617 domain-containing protein n=1 Tax=Kocuria rhizophila (strain ATCC 9341 / DSM 348 / NBRC 103217 / DC2201) TaxID=378753 RepID=B2GGZ5_KOCRD|nr:DUF2617 family protein [Kocuria rhizophila]BAG30361.1 hypothetical protein KRH_20140 [Kocuria rhizophila DC2201]
MTRMEHDWLTRMPGHPVCRPEQFGYRTDLGVLDAPAGAAITVDELTEAQLRVGPGHHQFVVSHAGRRWVETVGVFEEDTARLPVLRSIERPSPFAEQVEVGCTVTEHSPRGLRKELERIRTTLEQAPLAVCVQDTEEPAAVTAATCHPDPESHTLMWWTWRVLPECGAILRMRAELQLSTAPDLAA